MNDKQIMALIEERIAELDEARVHLTEMHSEHPDLLEEYSQVTERYNTSFDAVKNLLKELKTPDAVKVSSFSRDRKTFSTKYRPNLLPSNILTMPGIVKDIDSKKVEQYLASGEINFKDVEKASYEYSRAPSVRTDIKRAQLPSLVLAK